MVSSDSHDIVNKTDYIAAHLQHGIRRVVILDIDLHHGIIYLTRYESISTDTDHRKWDASNSMADKRRNVPENTRN